MVFRPPVVPLHWGDIHPEAKTGSEGHLDKEADLSKGRGPWEMLSSVVCLALLKKGYRGSV